MLSDAHVHRLITSGDIGYTPYSRDYLNPASIDMTLEPRIRVPKRGPESQFGVIDTRHVRPDHTELVEIPDGGYALYPGRFILACTYERVRIPDWMAARVEGKSSLGRIGLVVHITAGFIDPGFEGNITLEIANLSPWTILLHPGMRIAQLAFMRMEAPARKPYSRTGHYNGQDGPTESKFTIPELDCMGRPYCDDGVHDSECTAGMVG